ncbi:Crp/Fnr family transcriptional regulator [Sphingomonas sp. ID1715]|uniref:Crp/Fnr family transcriptional regulator n=1 Tax=Sphingomonas sp. ID1715 TaxID=1656898 RepID=UPI001487FBB9|nr:Crp/Fnr family transcriptional regulator [Sphingomonas sp. ID1715]NNM76546.1 Crp/Fnr family transcriptional regulator [Sphingomonas sp. ID1715]
MSRSVFDLIIAKFGKRAAFDEADREALRSLPHRPASFEPQAYISREGDRPQQVHLLISGFAYRQKSLIDGARQIIGVGISGDFLDLECALLGRADHNIQALTRCQVAVIPCAAVDALILSHSALARAMWIQTLIDGSLFREWIANVGRRDARSRLAHLLCEFARRLELAGMAGELAYELPMTQEQLADTLGLTPVHVNRVLKQLETQGLIAREKRFVRIPDWEALRRIGGFNETYLHLHTPDGHAEGAVSA